MVVIPSISAVATQVEETDLVLEIDPEVVTDLAQVVEIDPEVETDLALVAEIDPEAVTNLVQVVAVTDPVRDKDRVLGQDQAQALDLAQEQNQARAQVLGLDLVLDKDQVRATGVPLVARARVEVLHPGTVSVVHRAAPANHAQEAHPAEVVVDAAVPVEVVVDVVVVAAEVAVADVDVDLKWRLKTQKQPHRTIE